MPVMFRLTVLEGPEPHRSLEMSKGSLSIGKSPSNQIVLTDPFVSRYHGQVLWNGRAYVYIDLQSSNGSAIKRKGTLIPVGASRNFQMPLEDGDHILLGDQRSPVILSIDLFKGPGTEEGSGWVSDLVGKVEDITVIRSWKAIEEGLASDKNALTALYRLTRSLTKTSDCNDLFETLAETLFDAFPKGTHLMLIEVESEDKQGGMRQRMARARDEPTTEKMNLPVSRSLILKALGEETGILFSDAIRETSTPDSAREAHICSGILIPIQYEHGRSCVLQIDNRTGGEGFVQKDLQVLTVFSVHVSRILSLYSQIEDLSREKKDLEAENLRLRLLIQSHPERPEHIVGVSPIMQKIFRQLEKVADVPTTVLIQGETGTGKELAARALHFNSRFSKGPFVVQNCAALPETLLDGELFGHRKGAFTGAIEDKKGLFELADGGTLFLDEVSEMAYSTQAKLLRILEDGTFRRLGEEKERKCQVRVIGATNKDLSEEARANRYRKDLFYRLSAVVINIPPLRERSEDIPLLCEHLLERIAVKLGRTKPLLSPEALAVLNEYNYPGNVRELANILEGMAIIAGHQTLDVQHLPRYLQTDEFAVADALKKPRTYEELKQAKDSSCLELEKQFLEYFLAEHHGVIKDAAEAAGMNRSQFHQMISRAGINPESYRKQ